VIALNRLNLAANPERTGRSATTCYASTTSSATVRSEVDEFLTPQATPPASGRPVPSLAQQLAHHCLAFRDALHFHHTREDGVFTDFGKQFPELAPALDRLRREHHLVAQALSDLQTLLDDLASSSGTADVDKVRTELERLASGLEDHFEYEEQQLLPVLTTSKSL
jgi:hemerythrin-like domain-containing protein